MLISTSFACFCALLFHSTKTKWARSVFSGCFLRTVCIDYKRWVDAAQNHFHHWHEQAALIRITWVEFQLMSEQNEKKADASASARVQIIDFFYRRKNGVKFKRQFTCTMRERAQFAAPHLIVCKTDLFQQIGWWRDAPYQTGRILLPSCDMIDS